MTLEYWKNQGSYFKFKGHSIFYIDDQGDDLVQKEPLLLIHGFPTSSWDWWKIWIQLKERYRVITLDMIGFGFSDKPKTYDYSIFDQADIFETLLNQLDVGACHVLSHDYGDTVAQELLARQNSDELTFMMNSLCMLNGGLFPDSYKPRLIQKLLMSPVGSLVSKLSNKGRLRKTFKKIFGPNTQPSPEEIDEFWSLMSYNIGRSVIHKTIRYMKERTINGNRWVEALQKCSIPLRLIDGAHDPISGIHLAERYRQLIENPDVVILEDIGHYPQTEAPNTVLKHYFEFLDANYAE